ATDPVYTVSSEVDHARSSLKRRVPEFGSMFSNLHHHPRYTFQLDSADPVPTFIDRRWRGHTEQRREALQQLAGEDCHVTGADRWKYFKRNFPQMFFSLCQSKFNIFPSIPAVPLCCPMVYCLFFHLLRGEFESTGLKKAERQPTHCTVGVQTDYRESESQTDPYSPEYVVRPGTTPSELLRLAALTWGRGLPAGLAEVEMIQRARARRVWEASLPPLDDISQLDKRRRMMEGMEVEVWEFREGEIKKLQEARLAVLKDLVKQRDETQKEITSERLNQIHSKHLKEKEAKLNKIHKDYLRCKTSSNVQ
uniref:Cilia- and flagella-associated protein 91 n=1 Tax=Labrus bergylta TaxID=56723 RepID=A0A3Q3L386_9LABR